MLSLATTDYAESHGDSWGASMFLTFARLEENASGETFEQQATALAKAHYGDDTERRFFPQSITSLYLSDLVSVDGFRGDERYLWIFGAVALFILLLACVNYVNLSTARATQRAKEVGVRRTVGAGRFQVARQFLGESVLLTLGAFVLSLLVARAALPVFNYLTDKELSLFAGHPEFIGVLFVAAIAVGLVAGIYPAFYLSGFRPTDVLRGGSAGRGRRGARLRQGLVAFQFAVAVALIAATAVVYQQLRYTQQKDLGFEKEQLLTLSVPGGSEDAFQREVAAHPGVRSVSVADAAPGTFQLSLGLAAKKISSQAQPAEEAISFKPAVVDTQFVETMGLRVVAGRAFSSEHPADQKAFMLNEVFAHQMGWTPKEAVGKTLDLNGSVGEVVGVVEDFHIASLREKIEPVVLRLTPFESVSSYPKVAVRFAPGQTAALLDHLEATWAKFSEEPLDYTFLDEQFAEMYRTERRLGQVFSAFAVVAVLIACLGLFGLAAFAAERRSKEIAIRKTFGASARQIVQLLSKEFLLLVAVGFALAVPVAWYAMQRWLEDFAYRIELSPWLFAAAGLAALLVATGATSWQALRAARTNPAQALRDE